jgi:hypothetical protein
MMAVEVAEAPTVHELMVLWIHSVRSTCRDRGLDHLVFFGTAAARERDEAFRVLARIAQPSG